MIVILRERSGEAPPQGLAVAMTRPTPAYVDPAGGTDYFCDETAERIGQLEAAGHRVLRLKDGWYEAAPGGIAIWGGGKYYELRDTPFTVRRGPGRTR